MTNGVWMPRVFHACERIVQYRKKGVTMEPSPESFSSPELEAFGRKIELLRHQHQQVAISLCMDRLARQTVPEQPTPSIRQRLYEVDWLFWYHVLRGRPVMRPVRDEELTARVIVIDSATGTIEEVNRD